MNKPVFGMAGCPPNFFASPLGKNRKNIFKWAKEQGIDAIEWQCTYGIRMPEEQAIEYRKLAEEYNIYLSMHAPYYVSLASQKPDVVERSKATIKEAYRLAEILGIDRIIFHPGGGASDDRATGINRIITALNELEPELNTDKIKIYPEIGGKINQLGSLDEIIEICKKVKYARPCIDLAHLHAREMGSMTSSDKIVEVMEKIEEELGRDILEATHFHVYPVEYSNGGEKRHRVFGEKIETEQQTLFEEDAEYDPKAEDYIAALKQMNLKPVTICEAHDTQDEGAILMKQIYFNR